MKKTILILILVLGIGLSLSSYSLDCTGPDCRAPISTESTTP